MNNLMNNEYEGGELFGDNEFVLTESVDDETGKRTFVGGGYKVESFFLKGNVPIMTTYNNNNNNNNNKSSNQSGGKVSSPFENLAVPAGLFYINQKIPKIYFDENVDIEDKKFHLYKKHETVSDDIIDKLFGLVDADKKRKRKTKKHITKSNNKKTRKT